MPGPAAEIPGRAWLSAGEVSPAGEASPCSGSTASAQSDQDAVGAPRTTTTGDAMTTSGKHQETSARHARQQPRAALTWRTSSRRPRLGPWLPRSVAVLAAAASVAALSGGVAIPLARASAAATPACKTTINWIGLPGDGYAGGQVVQLEFSNTGKVTCTLHGHPGVAQMNAGRQVGRPAIWTGTPATVTLKPGATAHAVLNVRNAGALCAKPLIATSLSVIAPGQRLAFPDPYQSRACPGKSVMGVGPVRPGVGVPFYTS